LSVINISDDVVQQLGLMAKRAMRLQCTIQDNNLWLSDGEKAVEVSLTIWK